MLHYALKKKKKKNLEHSITCRQWHNRWGQSAPHAFHWEFFADLHRGKIGKGKGKREKKKEGTFVKGKGLIETTKFCFGCTKMQISTGKKHFTPQKKVGKK